ncbi:FAD-dependent oxidoreductase [Eggerthella sp. YY7918]|uniref:FAD-dependent oxidoreductase n=1 Tax=Eggerthella sp. (strain YY7918) TaxID=502558 RepID=UPI00021710C7|nr:FAD-dependent oxidoreductase [Eggerthella sp. YY7918]BAK43500.1 hypothetical protein EGYY_02640 [Eggerthella sp. YY7918]
MDISRRSFLQGSALGVTGIALMGITGCNSENSSKEGTETTVETIVATESLDCDVCVVGAGFSGLVAAVQAAEGGASVIALEASSAAGGAALSGIEGSFAADSRLAKEQGITVDIKKILMSEMDQSQWRADGLAWMEMMQNSGTNMDWLMDHGVKIEKIDNYHGKEYECFHWYKNGAPEGYAKPMVEAAEKAGVQFKFSTPAKSLIHNDDGEISGVYAQNEHNEWIEIHAKAVIIATGGFGQDHELCAAMGYPQDRILTVGTAYADGTGHRMAVEAGAKDFAMYACDNCGAIIDSIGFCLPNIGWCMQPQNPWINENCERFYKEDNCVIENSKANPPKWNQERCFMVWDSASMQAYEQGMAEGTIPYGDQLKKGFTEIVADAVNSGQGDIFEADTPSELAKKAGLDPTAMEQFFDSYNAMCESGNDELWSKDSQYLQALSSPPFYIAEPIYAMFATIGSVYTNRNGQVVDAAHHPIPRLYAVGVEGCMLYRNVYTIGTPGSCSGNSINSARTAAQHALKTYL